MRAMICHGANLPLVPEELKVPKLRATQILTQSLASGVCHSDLSVAAGIVKASTPFPLVLGHEAVGRVIAIGASVRQCRVGDLVIASLLPACGECWHCVRDESQHCETSASVYTSPYLLRSDGSKAFPMAGLGAFAELMCIEASSAVPVNSDLPVEQLAMIGCGVTTGVGAVLWTAKVEPGKDVAIFGCGGVGQAAVQGARLAGAGRIFAIDPAPLKRQMALAFGATDAVDPQEVDPVEYLKAHTVGRGVDYAFEITGLPDVGQQALASVRKRGMAVVVGMPATNSLMSVPCVALYHHEKHLTGSLYGSAQVRRHLEMLVRFAECGKLDLARMISKTIRLDQVNEAFDAMRDGSAIRSVVRF